MKRIVILTCIGSLALTLTALGAHNGKSAHRSSEAERERGAPTSSRLAAEASTLANMSPDMQVHRAIPQRGITIPSLERVTIREAAM